MSLKQKYIEAEKELAEVKSMRRSHARDCRISELETILAKIRTEVLKITRGKYYREPVFGSFTKK